MWIRGRPSTLWSVRLISNNISKKREFPHKCVSGIRRCPRGQAQIQVFVTAVVLAAHLDNTQTGLRGGGTFRCCVACWCWIKGLSFSIGVIVSCWIYSCSAANEFAPSSSSAIFSRARRMRFLSSACCRFANEWAFFLCHDCICCRYSSVGDLDAKLSLWMMAIFSTIFCAYVSSSPQIICRRMFTP